MVVIKCLSECLTALSIGSGPDYIDGQYYSVQDYIDVLQYAKARNIEVWEPKRAPCVSSL